ncbi:hypothetical protein TNCV_3741551 [Trichonephila clavipes]|nr:hypothetical protein TNCV_3741551 [Trichonephila clavipes]
MIQTPSMEQNVLDVIRSYPSTIVRAVAAAVGGSWRSIHCVLQREGLLSYSGVTYTPTLRGGRALEGLQPDYRQVPTLCKIQLGGQT